jgi:sulfate adenylyltransferase subunit 1 (EFTu-like GTPase family)
VTVTLVNGTRGHTRTVRASATGAFTVRFTLVVVDPCRGALTITARDRLGARAHWTRQCRPPSLTDPYPA